MTTIGKKIGPYLLIQKLGKGTFGEVWLAEHSTSIVSTRVALKIPLNNLFDINAIKEEATVWAKASGHPNILPIIEANIYEGQLVIVSEYASDGSLENLLAKNQGKSSSIGAGIDLVLGILAGLEHLHSRDIVHRDLKPANILIQGEIPRLADFGLSRMLNQTKQSTTIAGTLAYMAPEAFDGKRDQRTDIWALGIIWYEMLTGVLPFQHQGITELIGLILTKEIPPLPSNVPIHLHPILEKILKKNPEERYASATEIKEAIKALVQEMNGEGTVASLSLKIGASEEKTQQKIVKKSSDSISEKISSKKRFSIIPLILFMGLLMILLFLFRDTLIKTSSKNMEDLIQALKEEHWKQRLEAAEKLAGLGTEAKIAIPELLEILKSEPKIEVKIQIVIALGSMGNEAKNAIPLLQKIMQESTGALSHEVLKALKLIEGKQLTTTIENPGWPEALWNECWNEVGYVDFTVNVWEQLSPEQQMIYATSYQQFYAKKMKSPVAKIFTVGPTQIEMKLIPPGKFRMGSPLHEVGREGDENQHLVLISKPFWCATTEITQEQWECVIGKNPASFKATNFPVDKVSWPDCEFFCNQTQTKLLTEAQWEYSCRAGSSRSFCFGNDVASLKEYGWIHSEDSVELHPVGQKKSNAYGLQDMHGNVWEWCADHYQFYSTNDTQDPFISDPRGQYHLARGGCCGETARLCRSAVRGRFGSAYGLKFLGFRVSLPCP